jgi:hypothetical protein
VLRYHEPDVTSLHLSCDHVDGRQRFLDAHAQCYLLEQLCSSWGSYHSLQLQISGCRTHPDIVLIVLIFY